MNMRKLLIKQVRDAYILYYRLLHGIDKNKVVFTSFGGSSYSDNPRAVSEKMHEIAPKVKQIWLFHDPDRKKEIVPEYVQTVSAKNKWNSYKEFATCAALVTSAALPDIPKSRKQFFVQVWHGDRAFKKIQYDSNTKAADFSRAESKPGYCDLAVAGSDYGQMQFRSGFHYTGEILKVGTPRNDRLVYADPEEWHTLRQKLKVPDDVGILLYAPTLRATSQKNNTAQKIQNIDIRSLLRVLEKKYDRKWICFMRAHPAIVDLCGIDYDDKVRDLSQYDDMADLLLVSDMLITDYSSCAGDFALLGRPLILYQADRLEYLRDDRELYFDMETSPYYVAATQEALEKTVTEITQDDVKKNCRDILDFYHTTETGKASEAVAERILRHLEIL